MSALQAFSPTEYGRAKRLLATQVAAMMGRKLEEGDWTKVYCAAKGLSDPGWSNLHVDVNENGLGLEMKLLRIANLNGHSIKVVCGTTLMHPAATRSIRIDDGSACADDVMWSVFSQYAELIQERTESVREKAPGVDPAMRTGWLIWESGLSEFLYFEESMIIPDPNEYYAEWNETPARGARKGSRSLWIFEKQSQRKRYSVTTSAGIKIQPYFDVPPTSDPNLYYFRVQSEPVDNTTVVLWVAGQTARALQRVLGSLDLDVVSGAVLRAVGSQSGATNPDDERQEELAVPIQISMEAHARLVDCWGGAVSDEHRAQLLLKVLGGA